MTITHALLKQGLYSKQFKITLRSTNKSVSFGKNFSGKLRTIMLSNKAQAKVVNIANTATKGIKSIRICLSLKFGTKASCRHNQSFVLAS